MLRQAAPQEALDTKREDFRNLFSHHHSHFCLPLAELPAPVLFSILQCLQLFIRSRNACYVKTRFRSWRSLLVSFGMFLSERTTFLHLILHACRTVPPRTTCTDMKLRFIAIKLLSNTTITRKQFYILCTSRFASGRKCQHRYVFKNTQQYC